MPSKKPTQKDSTRLFKDKASNLIKGRVLSEDFDPIVFLSERQVAGLLKLRKSPIKAAFERLELGTLYPLMPKC